MPEAVFVRDANQIRLTAEGSVTSGEVRQVSGGRAAVFDNPTAASAGEQIVFNTAGQYMLPKATGVVILDGGRVYWDHSANNATFKAVNDRDFYIGTAVGDWASGDTFIQVNLNAEQNNLIDLNRDPFETVFVGTRSLGVMDLQRRGGAHKLNISITTEAQKIDMLSQAGFVKTANAIAEFIINVRDDGAGTVVDVSVGLADGTHASDADIIANSIFCHLDANNVNINFESDDGTTEVAATDSTLDYTAGTPFEVWMDMRNPADVQIYVDGVLVLGSTVFNVNTSSPTWKLLVHIEKSSSTDTYELDINRAVARIMEQ